MNKSLLFSMFAATGMLLATSCSNDELNAVQSSDEAQVSFALGLEGAIGSRAISDGSGADKLVYAVYKVNAKTGATELQNVEGSTNGQFVKTDFKSGDNVSVTLAKGQTYQVAFWAQDGDCKAYNTSDLTNVTVDYTGVNNDELRDAFYKTIEFTVSGNKTIDVVLKRPFAQINVGVYKSDWNAAVASGITIEKSSVVIKDAATSINLLTGAVGDQTTDVSVNYTSELIPREDLNVDLNKNGTIEEDEKYAWLSMSYILVADHDNDVDENGLLGTDRTTLNGLAYTFTPAEGGHAIEFKEGLAGAPVQRNWRTNILGKILTGDIQFNITIDPVYDGDIKYPDAAAQDLELAATFGGTVTLTENVALTAPLNVTADMILNLNGKTMSGALNVAEGISLTVENGTITPIENNGEKLYVNGITSNGNLTLNNVEITSTRHAVRIESGNAVINGGIYKVSPISKSTLHALHVGDDGTVANVIVKGGTFIGAKGTSADSGAAVNVKKGSSVTIEGGDFSGGKNKTLSAGGTLEVKGGTFDQDPSTYVAAGYYATKVDNKYVVSDAYLAYTLEDLQAALDAPKADIRIMTDLTGNVTVTEYANTVVTINGSGKTFNGQMFINGKSDSQNATTVFENINFVTENNSTLVGDAFIYCGEGKGTNYRYPDAIVVKGCTFTANGAAVEKAVAVKFWSLQNSLVIEDVEANSLHSLLQATSNEPVATLLIDGVTIQNGKNGISLDNAYNTIIRNSNINAREYGVRANSDRNAGSLAIENTTIEAKQPVIVRKVTKDGYNIKINDATELITTEAYQVIITKASDDVAYVAPEAKFICNVPARYNVFPLAEDVAYVSTTDMLSDALNDTNVEVISLGGDITYNNTDAVSIEKDLEIYANGETITAGGASSLTPSVAVMGDYDVVVNNANVVGGFVGAYYGANVTYNGGSLKFTDGMSGRNCFYAAGTDDKQSVITINDIDVNMANASGNSYLCAHGNAIIYVTGGNFYGKPAGSSHPYVKEAAIGSYTGKVIISGGTFNFDPTEWLAAGYKATKNGSTWTVSAK